MDTKAIAAGNHAWIVRDGDTLEDASTAARENAPAADDSSLISLGLIDLVDVEPTEEEREVMAASPGLKTLYDVVPISAGLTFRFTGEEVGPLTMEYLYKSATPLDNTTTTYSMLEGKNLKAWVKIDQYDSLNTLFNSVLVYAQLKLAGAVQFGSEVKPQWQARVLQSSLNVGGLVATP